MDQLRLCDPGDKDGEVKVAEYERPAMSESNLVPEVGIEPTLPEGNGILSPARLPVSPLRPAIDRNFSIDQWEGAGRAATPKFT